MPVMLRIILIATITLALGACTSKEDKIVNELTGYHRQVGEKVSALKVHIDQGRLRNIPILKTYAEFVRKERPEMNKITGVLLSDASSQGPMFQSLVTRLSESKQRIPIAAKQGVEASRGLTNEFNAIYQAASTDEFNLMLTDPINVLAGMSNGKLSRVNELNNKNSSTGVTPPAGSELVGNPNYGQWKQNSSGTSFWAFYGQYAFFSSLFSSPVRYDSWSVGGHNSYYRNRGRDYYTSPSHQQRYQKTESREKKNFAKQGKSFQSPYANKTASAKSSSGSRVSKAPGKFQSTFGGAGSSTKTQQSSSKTSSRYNSRPTNSSSRSFSSGGK